MVQVLSGPVVKDDPKPIVTPATSSQPSRQRQTDPARTLAELKQLPAKELQEMLDKRGVRHSSLDKDDLATWVHQHQHIPVKESAKANRPMVPSHSLQELKQMSVKDLREMLASRGVPEGSATEKSDLATWVWQHQHLPVLHRASGGRKGRRFGFGPGGDSGADSEPVEEPEVPKLEANDAKQIEGDETKLLEGTSEEVRRWPLRTLALVSFGVLAILVAAVATNDAMQVTEEQMPCQRGWKMCAGV